jgi:sterol desaturase/sphingolipid hydroxylase (fatty acid hydroxylase superfamily)
MKNSNSGRGMETKDTALPFLTCLFALSILYGISPVPSRGIKELSFNAVAVEIFSSTFVLRCIIGGAVGLVFYFMFAALVHFLYPRKPVVGGVERNIFDILVWNSDISLGILGIVCGSPILQTFMILQEQFGVSLMYDDVASGKLTIPFTSIVVFEGWVWIFAQIPIYLILFDLVFYWTHLILHWGPVYTYFHSNHHAFRPPTAWSGIAIDPVENILTGMMPYHCPLFLLPFNKYVIFSVNIILVGWATLLHSGCHIQGGWLFIGPMDHNVHHARGLENMNFSAIFSIWDLIFGTLDREGWTNNAMVPFWVRSERDSFSKLASSVVASVEKKATATRRTSVTAGLKARRVS